MARNPKIRITIRRRIEWLMVLGILSAKPDSPDGRAIIRSRTKMFDDKVSGVLGVVASFGGFGGAAFVVASLMPMVAAAAAALVVAAGAHTWVTRRR
jgi:hypothetical protein